MPTDSAVAAGPAPARRLLVLIVPALAVGVASALVLLGVSLLAEQLQDVLWETLPDALSVGRYSSLWMIVMLTAMGLVTGLVLRAVPGRGGPDPATMGLVDPPLPPYVVPGLLVVTVLALAGGVSLGPENPITAPTSPWPPGPAAGSPRARPVRYGSRSPPPAPSAPSSAPRSPPP